jgi:hypothetical protein
MKSKKQRYYYWSRHLKKPYSKMSFKQSIENLSSSSESSTVEKEKLILSLREEAGKVAQERDSKALELSQV